MSPSSYAFVGVTNSHMASEGLHYITLFVAATIDDTVEPENAEPEKCEEWRWVPWTEVSALELFQPLRQFIDAGLSPFTGAVPGIAQQK